MLKEEAIVQLLYQNDRRAIEWMYDQYGAVLYGVVLKIVQSEETAEDLIQDTFVKVWKNARQYDSSKGTLFTWVLNIARNTAIDKRRSVGFRNQQMIQSIPDFVYKKKDHQHVFDPNTIGLDGLVQKLDQKYREIIDLIYFQGLTQKEVEDELAIPLGTVKSRLRIGLRELRSLFAENKLI